MLACVNQDKPVVGILSVGILSGSDFVRWDFVRWDFVRWDFVLAPLQLHSFMVYYHLNNCYRLNGKPTKSWLTCV